MHTLSLRRLATLIGLSVAVVTHVAPAQAFEINHNLGRFTDTYSDMSGTELGDVGVEDGQFGIQHDAFGSLVTLDDNNATGYYYTREIEPSSFSAWGRVYIDFTSQIPSGVQVYAYDGSLPLDLLTLTPSDDPNYARMATIPYVGTGVEALRLKVVFTRGAATLPPTVKALKVTWIPRSVLGVALEAPASRPAGDGIVVRVQASVSFVDANNLYAWLPLDARDIDNEYLQPADLTFVSATEGGAYTAAGIPAAGIPPKSVYWFKPTLKAGNTLAFYATLRSNNGLVNGLGYELQARLSSTNSDGTKISNQTLTRLTSGAKGYLDKTSSGTFMVGGLAHAAPGSIITLRVNAGNWVFTPIPTGAQTWNKALIIDDAGPYLAQGTLVPGSISPGGDINDSGGTENIVVGGHTYAIPDDHVYWIIDRIDLGSLQSLSYRVQLAANAPDVTMNGCATLSSKQYDISSPDPNRCQGSSGNPGDAATCAPITDCHPIRIFIDNTPGWAFGKGDSIDGSTQIRTGVDDNAERFVTYGDTITFKLSVGNSGLSKLEDVVMFDKVPAGTEFVSATIPAATNGTIWYYTDDDGAGLVTPPAFFENPGVALDNDLTATCGLTDDAACWTQTAPDPEDVTWVAYWVPRLSSTYFPDTNPTSAIADFTVRTTTDQGCVDSVVTNRGHVFIQRLANLTSIDPTTGLATYASETALASPLTGFDDEPVDVRPVLPNLTASMMIAPPSANPSESKQWVLTVYNHDRNGNPVDTALDVTATIDVPQVVANGVLTYLTFEPGSGNVDTENVGGVITRLTLSWDQILPEQSQTTTLSFSLPKGIENADVITMAAALSADDDLCGSVSASASGQTFVTSSPELEVIKDVDLTVVAPGTAYNYELTYVNGGSAPSTETWVIDRLPDGLEIVAGSGPAYGQVWFAGDLKLDPSDPNSTFIEALEPGLVFDDAFVRSRFTPGIATPTAGRFKPTMAFPRWVAFLVDDPDFDPTVTPPILKVDEGGVLGVEVRVATNAPVGTTLTNEALIDSAELLQAISNRVVTVVSARPGLQIDKTCPALISNLESFDYDIFWVNDTTNIDDTIIIVETFPLGFVPDGFEDANGDPWVGDPVPDFGAITASEDELLEPTHELVDPETGGECLGAPETCRLRVSWVFPPKGSLGTAFLKIPGQFVDVLSNTLVSNSVVGIAENDAGAFSVAQTCPTRVLNPELFMQKFVSRTDPRSGEFVTFTLIVQNVNARDAHSVRLEDFLEDPFILDAASFQEVTPNWELSFTSADADGGTDITIRLDKTTGDYGLGDLPGNSGPVMITYRAQVAPGTPPDTTIANTVEVFGQPGEDPESNITKPNVATIEVTTPLPDPALTMTGPSLVKPGEQLTWNIFYANEAREDATNTVVLVTFPDGPNGDGNADFTYVSHTAPAGVQALYSNADLGTVTVADDITSFPAYATAGLWSTTPLPDTNYMLFLVDELAAFDGPFTIGITAVALEQDGDEVPPGVLFTAAAEIALIATTYPDDDLTNNHGAVTTATPSTDMGITVTCNPDGGELGILPGAVGEFSFEIVNTGTVNAFGIKVDTALDLEIVPDGDPSLVSLESHSASVALVTDAQGVLVNPLGSDGQRLTSTPSWTTAPIAGGTRFYLGMEPDDYRTIGLRPGDRLSVTLRVRVREDDTVLTNTPLVNQATVITDGQNDFAEDDNVTANNVDACETIIYRADPFVIKSAVNLGYCGKRVDGGGLENVDVISEVISTRASAEGIRLCEENASVQLVDAGDTLLYAIRYGNAGSYDASDVVITDALPIGTTYIEGSLTGVPPGVVAEGREGDSWNLDIDEDAREIRLSWDDDNDLSAPANSFFTASSTEEFRLGRTNGTYASEGSVRLGGAVTEVPSRSEITALDGHGGQDGPPDGGYWSPEFPGPDEGKVVRWDRVIVQSTLAEPGAPAGESDGNVTIDVIDPRDGSVILSNVIPDGTGTYDLSSLSPAQYPELKLQATLDPWANGCMVDLNPTDRLFTGYPTGINEFGTVTGFATGGSGTFEGHDSAFAWTTGNRKLLSLHDMLPGMDSFEDFVPFHQSRTSDIESFSARIVGYAATDPRSSALPEACGGAARDEFYFPDYLETSEGIDDDNGTLIASKDGITFSRRMQMHYEPRAYVDRKVLVRELHFRQHPDAPATTGTIYGVEIYMGHGEKSDTFSSVTGVQLVYSGDIDVTIDPAATDPWSIVIELDTPFEYDPLDGTLVVDWGIFGDPTGVAYTFDNGVPVIECESNGDYNFMHAAAKVDGLVPDYTTPCAHSLRIITEGVQYTAPAANAYSSGPSEQPFPPVPTFIARKFQQVTPAAEFAEPVLINEIRFRPFSGQGSYSFSMVIAMGTSTWIHPQEGFTSDVFAENYNGDRKVVFSDGVDPTDGQPIARDITFDVDPGGEPLPFVSIPLTQPFYFNPHHGRDLVLEFELHGSELDSIWLDYNPGYGKIQSAAQVTDTRAGFAAATAAYTVQFGGTAAPAPNPQPAILWTPDDDFDPTEWKAQCLPAPDRFQIFAGREIRTPRTPSWNGTFIEYNSYLIAGTYYPKSLQGAAADTQAPPTGFGTPVVWCDPDPYGNAFDYEALPIVDADGNLTLPSVVTGINTDGWVIGVSFDAAKFAIVGSLWAPNATDGPCPSSWTRRALNAPDGLAGVGEVYPLDFDEGVYSTKSIVGEYRRTPQGLPARRGAVRWTLNNTGVTAIEDLGDYHFLTGTIPTPLTPTGPTMQYINEDGDVITTNVPRALTDASAHLFYQGNTAPETLDVAAFDATLGVAINNDLGIALAAGDVDGLANAFLYNPWEDPSLMPLGSLPKGAGLNYYPSHVGSARWPMQVIGIATGAEGDGRVWYWEPCEDTTYPTLDAWSVTYETDRPPSFELAVTVDDFCQESVINHVDITTTTPEITAANNHSEVSIVLNKADIEAVVSASADVVMPDFDESGVRLDFEAVWTNLGPGTSRDVDLYFEAPPEGYCYSLYDVAFDGDSASGCFEWGGPCTGYFYCYIDKMHVGESLALSLLGQHGQSDPDRLLTATAYSDARTVDCNEPNDIGSVSVVVGEYANLWVGISGPPYATSSSGVTYTISYGNNGNEDEDDGVVSFITPPGLTFVSASVTPDDVSEGVLTWEIGAIDAGTTGTLSVTFTGPGCQDEGIEGYYDNLALIDGTTPEADIVDNEALTTTWFSKVDGALMLDFVNSHVVIEAGEQIATTVYFTNSGGAPVGGAQLSVGIPGGAARYIVGSATPAATQSGDVLRWSIGSLLPGEVGSVTFRYAAASGETSPTQILFDAVGACDSSLPLYPPYVVPQGGLNLNALKSASTGTYCPDGDDTLEWTILVTNDSDEPVLDIVVTDDLTDDGWVYEPGTLFGGDSNVTDEPGVLVWHIDELPAGGAVSVGYRARYADPDARGLRFNRADVETDILQGNISVISSEGFASAIGAVLLSCEPTAVVSKLWNGGCQVAGKTLDVGLTIENTSDKAIRNGTLSDYLPPGFDIELPTGDVPPERQIAWDGPKRTVTFNVATLLPGQKRTYSFTAVRNAPGVPGQAITNRAALRADGFLMQTSNQVAGAWLECGDGIACTVDTCDAGGCLNVPTVISSTDLCDGIDDDCDQLVDEDHNITSEFCGTGDCRVDGDEICLGGVVVFRPDGSDATYAECMPDFAASDDEVCNGEDDDCDGFIDDGLGLGTLCTAGLGACEEDGVLVCGGGGDDNVTCSVTGLSAQGRVELCGNDEDDDCDGVVDLDFAEVHLLGDECDSNETLGGDADECVGGVYVCSDDNTTVVCTDDVASIAETCNGADDDCDGDVDEGFFFYDAVADDNLTLGELCDGAADSDLCRTGVVQCAGGVAVCAGDVASPAESCNGIDDDCDGAIDENWKAGFPGYNGPFLGTSCDGTNDSDLCPRGFIECNLAFTDVYCHEIGEGSVETCNGVDDDCDTQTDEDWKVGFPGYAGPYLGDDCEGPGVGACAEDGVFQCGDDNRTECFVAEPIEPSEEVCNGEDDNCDGVTDDPSDDVCVDIETDILTGPPALTSSTSATFTYVNPEASPVASHTTFECSLDGASWVVCNHSGTNPSRTYTNLANGSHTLLVRATRDDGAVDQTPDFWAWVVDSTVPDTVILSAPTNPSQSPGGTFVFGSPTPNPSFYSCVLDPAGGVCPASGAADYAVCPVTYPVANLADGSHTICVYVTNTAGTRDPLPASYTWVIDTTLPETEIVAVIPPKLTSSTSVTFNYVDPTAPATNTFECSLDGAAWIDCDGKTDTYTGLPEGEHTFDVRTVDPNGNVDPTPASYTWVIDRTAPCPTIVLSPADPAQSGTATFGFEATEADVTYFCALDAPLAGNGQPAQAAYSACDATVAYDDLADGTHRLFVYTVDAAGNVGTCRASYVWVIDTRFPETEITAGPPSLVGSGEDVTLTYVDPTDEDLITFECSLDGATFTRCDGTTPGDGGTIDYDGLDVGVHTFAVRACDFTRPEPVRCDPTPATWQWEVTLSPCPNDRTAPLIECPEDVVLECEGGGSEVDLGSLAPTASDVCLPLETTTSASATVGLGQTPIVFTSTDGNGNVSSCITLVDVVDVTAPVVTCPADVLDATTDPGTCGAALDLAAATALDSCQGAAGILVLDDGPAVFTPGETVVTHHAVDAFGNEATCTQRVVVRDDEPLVLTCSDSATVDADADKCEWTGVLEALATDNCAEQLTVDVTGTYPVGTSPVYFTAEDGGGNTDDCTTELTVRDVTDPTVACGDAVGTLPTVVRATGADACVATVVVENVACARVIDGVSTPVGLDACPVVVTTDAVEIEGRLPDGDLVVTWQARATDPSGNTAVVDCTETYQPDRDADGVVDANDNCVADPNQDQGDADGDGIGEACDVCPGVDDPDQADSDGNGIGDLCQDRDRDEVLDLADNCVDDPNTEQEDMDLDEVGDACDPVLDGLMAEGDGSCSGGAGALGGLLGLGALLMLRGRRRTS